MFKERLIISILVATLLTTSLHSVWLKLLHTDAKKTCATETFAIKDNESRCDIKTAADVSMYSVLLTVPQNTTANKPLISESIFGVIVGGIIGFVSGIVVDIIKRWLTRPIITINENTSEVDFDLKTHHELEGHIIRDPRRTKYTGTRIKIENNGGSAAEDCKATLITKETELRVGWMIPKQDSTVTINADDVEYLDLCAISENGTDRVFTTERGYGEYADSARRINVAVIDAKLKVSAKNAKQCVKSIRIFNLRDSNNKIVRFTE